ncbi:MAG: rhodanese-like domain-containing protein [Candidatus Competibacterales bacterium]|nr:rhodanese-like domain-containing protein [Candidatus Competibacterales bacterium]
MTEFFDFALRHWYLFAALFAILGLLIGGEVVRKLRGVSGLNPTQALALINHQDAVVVDIRDGNEYKAGHLPEARHIPMRELDQRTKELHKFKNRPIIVYCNTDTRAGSAGAKLKKAGFEQIHSLRGGLAAWRNANLPVTRK